MQECPHCAKRLNDNFAYCRICGTKLSGENPGDFTTEMLNVFNHEDGFTYLFSDKGNQVILKAGTIDELAALACERKYPWEFRDKSKNSHKTPHFENDFLKASSIQEPEVIPTSSTAKKDESYVVDFEVSHVREDKNEGSNHEMSMAEIGNAVMSRGIVWCGDDKISSKRSFKRKIRRNRPTRKFQPKDESYWQNKFKTTRQLSQRRTDMYNERLAAHNMDKLLR